MSICEAFLEDDSGSDRELVAGETHSLESLDLIDAGHLEEDAARLDHGHPGVWRALTGAHSGFGRLLRRRLVGEDADPDLAAALDRAGHGASSCLDLATRDPGRLGRGKAEFAECHGRAALGDARHPASLDLAVLDLSGHQHRYTPCPTTAGAATCSRRGFSAAISPR